MSGHLTSDERDRIGGCPFSETGAEPFSLAAEEKRQQARGRQRRKRNRPLRRGRIRTADKLALTVRTDQVFPVGIEPGDCKLSHTRCVWRLENAQAALVAYEVYRGPRNQYGKIPGVIGRSEFGLEIVLAVAYQAYVVGLSFDKVCLLSNFFQGLQLRKSQVDALLRRLARHWEGEFVVLCTLLAHSAVVHADETLRQHLSHFTLSSVIREVLAWPAAGQSCFARLLAQLRPTTPVPLRPVQSILDRLLPGPHG